MKLLELKDVSVLRGGRRVVDSLTLQVKPGELKAIIGPNGSGKSTLLRLMAGLWKPSQGHVAMEGKSLPSFSRSEIARRIAYVPQEHRIDFAFTVEEVVGMGRYPHRGRFTPESAEDHRAVDAAMERCDVSHFRKRLVTTLSGGEHQRVLIARSLAVDPEVILLDEPTASLDVEHALTVLELCRGLASDGKAVVLATHDLNAVARFATDVVLLETGRMVGSGACSGVLNASNLERTFGVRAELLSTGDGHRFFVFHPQSGSGSAPLCNDSTTAELSCTD